MTQVLLSTSGNKKRLTEQQPPQTAGGSPTQQRKRTLLHIKMLSGRVFSPPGSDQQLMGGNAGHINVEDGGINVA
jgi:hypothetical protein